MLEIVKEFIARHKLLEKGDTVLAGVSGGPDSVVLLHVLLELQAEYNLKLHAAHLNHMFRGEEAAGDARLVRSLCERFHVPCTTGEEDVPAFNLRGGFSAEEGARMVRYRFFSDLAKKIAATKVALGHHADDQAETVLLNLLRGSGLRGLGGMRPQRGLYIRPLLGVTRAEILQYAKRHELPSRTDSSNLETAFTRNHIRLELLPFLADNYNPRIVGNLNEMADVLRVENDYLEKITDDLFKNLVRAETDRLSIEKESFAVLPPALQRRMLRRMYGELAGAGTALSYKTVSMMEVFLQDENSGKNLGLPREIVLKNKSAQIIFSKPRITRHMVYNMLLEVPGRLTLPSQVSLRAEILATPARWREYRQAGQNEAYLDLTLVKLPLMVRSRRPGDAFYPLGLKGKKKIKDFFIAEKIPVEERNLIPLVADSDGQIVWIGGYRIDERYKISASTSAVLHLILQKG